MDIKGISPVTSQLDQEAFDRWMNLQCGTVTMAEVWHAAVAHGRANPDQHTQPRDDKPAVRVFALPMLDGVDDEVQALHLCMQILDKILPVNPPVELERLKFNEGARYRIIQYLDRRG